MCHSAYIISPAPKVSVPILVLQASIPLEYNHCALAFQVSHERRDPFIRRYAHQHMNMILHCVCLDYFYSFSLT